MADELAVVKVENGSKVPEKKSSSRALTKQIKKIIADRAPSLVEKSMNALSNRLDKDDLFAVTTVAKILGFAGDGPATVINNNINNNNMNVGGGKGRGVNFDRILQTMEDEDARVRESRPVPDVQDAEFENVD